MLDAPMIVTVLASLLAMRQPPNWIWAPGANLPPHVFFRRTLDLEGAPTSGNLDITCDDAYTLYVNGKEAAHHASWYTMQSVDLRRYLTCGRNVLAVEARNLQGPAGLLVEGSVWTSGHKVEIVSDESWKVSTAASPDWKSPQFDDSTWTTPQSFGALGVAPWGVPVRESDLLKNLLSIRSAAPLSKTAPDPASPDVAQGFHWPASMTGEGGRFVRQAILPVSTAVLKDGTIKADFGREVAGWVEVEVQADAPPTADIQVGEANKPQGPFSTVATTEGKRTTFRLLPTGDFTGFRFAWIKLSDVKAPFRIARVQAVWRMWPANYAGSFQSSDPTLNRIWQICAYTAHLNLDPVAFSAILRPERGDRFPWMGDDRVTHRTVFDVFGDYDLVRADLDYFVKPRQKEIALNNIPGYTLDWVIALYDYWMYSGDTAEVRRHLGDVQTILRELDTQGTPPGWLFTDWEPGLQSTSDESVLAFHWKYVQAAREAADMADALGEPDLRSVFHGLAASRAAFLGERTLGAHALTNKILAGDKSPFPAAFPDHTSTPYFTYYVLEALSADGENTRALEGLRTCWGGMVRLGATSTWEYFLPQWAKTLKPLHEPPEINDPKIAQFEVSLCHPWSSGGAAWISQHILGITPTAPGFRTCEIKPYFAGLAWAKGSVPTPRGPVSVQWRRVNGKTRMEIDSPVSVFAELVLPDGGVCWVDGRVRGRGGSRGIDFPRGGKHVVVL
jgi:alpha-L-rhamnosidase